MRLLRKPQGEMREHIVKNGDGSDLRFLTFPGFEALEEKGFLRHCFSTREGGVSKGIYESMDLSFKLGDDLDDVYENFDRLAAVIGTTKPERIRESARACDFTLTRKEWYEIYLAAGNRLP